jgi:chemotaxis-related protein WspD
MMNPTPEHESLNQPMQNSAATHPFLDQAIQRLLDQPLQPGEMQESTQRVARPLQPPDKHVQRFLSFQLRGQCFAVSAKSVVRVTRAALVHRIPHRSNALIRGLCHLEGDLLLCADLANLLEIEVPVAVSSQQNAEQQSGDDRRMIVLQDQSHVWVVEVDTVEGVIPVIPADLQAPPLTVDTRTGHFTANVIRHQNQLVAVLDLPRVLSSFQAALS